MTNELLQLDALLPIEAFDAGLMVSRGRGRHPDRVWPDFDLIFVRTGELHIQEQDRPFEVRAGETLLLWPGRRHWGTQPYKPDLMFYWLHFQRHGQRQSAGETLPAVPQHAILLRPDHMTELFRRFLDDQEAGAQDPTSASLLALLMLGEVSRSRLPGSVVPQSAPTFAGRADTYIRAHFHKEISASGVAAALGCNPNYLARLFRQLYGMTITEAIHRRRLEYARRLLIEGYENVDEIARECGFEDVGYFRRLFKRHEGMTPLAFRRLYTRVAVNTE